MGEQVAGLQLAPMPAGHGPGQLGRGNPARRTIRGGLTGGTIRHMQVKEQKALLSGDCCVTATPAIEGARDSEPNRS